MISYSEAMWLRTRGGRSEADVLEDENGKYVYMSAGVKDEQVRVYIPENFKYIIRKFTRKQNELESSAKK